MNPRLIPVNAFVGLVSPAGTSWPNPLHQAGYSLTALELPLDAQGERVVADAVAFNSKISTFIVVEAKSGKHIDLQQAERYGHVDPHRIVQDTGVSVTSPQGLTVSPLYVCLSANKSNIVDGLHHAGCSYPVLSVAEYSISLAATGAPPGHLEEAFAHPISTGGWPSAAIHIDDQSTDDEYRRIASQALVAAAGTAAGPEISVSALAERAMPFLPLYGDKYRSLLIRKFEQALRYFCNKSAGSYEFRPSAGARRAAVRVLQDPSGADPRGRAQSYQALRRPFRGQRTSQVASSQLTLFDEDRMALIEQLDELQDDGPDADSTTREEP